MSDQGKRISREIQARVERRMQSLPIPTFPEELPISARRGEIAKAIREHQVVIVCGETGSGKSTQLPKICLSIGRGVKGLIGHTQPRRIAARTIAARIAHELKGELGQVVGYKVRFSDRTSPDAYIKVMTDGILLAETEGDRRLAAYDTLIIDEAHERGLNIDLLLGYLKTLLPRRPDLKVIVTSATINPQRFSRHFDNAPVIEVSGRLYPVEVRYRPLRSEDEDEQDRDLQQAILDAVDELSRLSRGDILIFLPGEREIRETAEALRKHHPPETDILPLYARLSAAEQDRVFKPHGRRRIVLATNVAETSLTVPGIQFVIDTGLARINRYSPRAKVQRLLIEKISKASADQRKGRCGRVSEGVCIRLYAPDDFDARPAFTDPEILRTSLASVILKLASLRFGDVEEFPFMEPPEGRYINAGYKLLEELGAVDGRRELTPVGRQLTRLPVDPRIGRMLLAARAENCLTEVLIIASALSVQDPRERPLEAQQKADEAHRQFADERSDFLWYLKLWAFYEEQSRHLSKNKLHALCRECFVSYMRMREWQEIHSQLRALVHDMGFATHEAPADYDAIHRALLTGLIGNLGFKTDKTEYTGARGIKFHVFPGSTLFKKSPAWMMAAELAETSRLYARTVARIEPEWAEQVGRHLVRKSYADPHWEKRAGRVAAYEKVTLYGLTLVTGRKVNYGPIDPAESRRLFIQAALVEGDFETRAPFFHHNRKLIESIEELQHRARRLDILADEQALFDFYDQRVPPEVHDARAFDKWRKEAERENTQLLYLEREDLLRSEAGGRLDEAYPTQLTINGMGLPLSYRFEPGSGDDGVTVTIPLMALNQMDPRRFEWLVPGLLKEKIAALIRALPKSLRRNFVPAPNFAEACFDAFKENQNKPGAKLLPPGRGKVGMGVESIGGHGKPLPPSFPSPCKGEGTKALTASLSTYLHKMTGVMVPEDAWSLSALPDHLRMNFRVVNPQGRLVGEGRDLATLQGRLGEAVLTAFRAVPRWAGEQENITRWDFGDLTETMETRQGGVALKGYPALVDRGNSVSIQAFDTLEQARAERRGGLRRLFMLALSQQMKYLKKNLPGFDKMALLYAPVGKREELMEDLLNAIVERAFLGPDPDIRTEAVFNQRLERGRGMLVETANELCALVGEVLARFQGLRKSLNGPSSMGRLAAVADIRDQLSQLIYPGFISATPDEWLKHLPRYLRAIALRLEKLDREPAKDQQKLARVAPFWRAYKEHPASSGSSPGLQNFHWLLEEFRVSVFAQELGTLSPVSEARLAKEWGATSR
jgi:ATP-dependent helicase HrpA